MACQVALLLRFEAAAGRRAEEFRLLAAHLALVLDEGDPVLVGAAAVGARLRLSAAVDPLAVAPQVALPLGDERAARRGAVQGRLLAALVLPVLGEDVFALVGIAAGVARETAVRSGRRRAV